MNKLQKQLEYCSTIDEVISLLKDMKAQYGGDTRVAFGYTANDYWKTQIAKPVNEIEVAVVSYTDYHQTLKQEDCKDFNEQDEDQARVILLTSNC